jgi:hypothetical protein
MRLTLRTMLAYLDDILEPDDAEDIGKKIAESDFATSLVHRTRDCVRRLRLGTPAVMGRGLGADPNTVAEYLDNTLEGERVPEIEKICLESDVHLAEVASCHQILTLVLGEPAEIDPASRERMYQAVIHAGETTPETELTPSTVIRKPHLTPSPSDTQEIDPAMIKRPRREVPDYLRESSSGRKWPLMAALAAVAAVLTLAALLLLAGPPELRQMVAKWMGQPSKAQEEPEQLALLPEKPANDAIADKRDDAEEPNLASTASPDETEKPAIEEREPAADLSLPRPSLPDEDSESAAPAPTPREAAVESEPEATADSEPNETAPTEPEPAAETPADEPPTPRVASTGKREPIDIAPAAGQEMGRYLSDNQVTLVFDQASSQWRRLQPKAVLAAGDKVLLLPSFRPALALNNGITLQGAGPGLLDFQGFDESGTPVVEIEYGRATILTVGKAGNSLRLRLGGRDVVLTFGTPQSTAAIEVMGLLTPGKDPEEGPADLAVDLYATSGQITWNDGSGEHSLKTPEHVSLTAQSAANLPDGQFPDWVHRDTTSAIDRGAAAAIEKELTPDRALSLTLKELAQNRRIEVRSLAIRCGGYLGDFDANVAALNDTDQHAAWPAQVESLRAALARGPQVAAQVRETIEKQRSGDARSLYRMLWGYTADQLKAGDAAVLVDNLNSDALDIRVLALWNLRNITGSGLFYRPEYPEARRRPYLLKWREKLKDGKIVPAGTPPAAKSASL